MSDLRQLFGETSRRLLADLVTPDVLRRTEEGEFAAALWTACEESGLTRVLVPESDGGAGGTWEDAFELLHAAGRFAAPVPLGEAIVAGALLARAGLRVPTGVLTIASESAIELLDRPSGVCASGTIVAPWGRDAAAVVAVGSTDDGDRLMVLPTAQATLTRRTNMAGEPRDVLHFTESTPIDIASSPGAASRLRFDGALARSVQLAGGVARLLELSVGYAGERKQFGKPIAAFQAIQHLLAVLAEQSAAADMAAQTACRAVDRGDAAFEIAVAKIRAGEAAMQAAAIAHEVHGAIGFTHEHVLHFTTRRLWSWRPEFGAEAYWAREVGRDVIARGADALWSSLTARD